LKVRPLNIIDLMVEHLQRCFDLRLELEHLMVEGPTPWHIVYFIIHMFFRLVDDEPKDLMVEGLVVEYYPFNLSKVTIPFCHWGCNFVLLVVH